MASGDCLLMTREYDHTRKTAQSFQEKLEI